MSYKDYKDYERKPVKVFEDEKLLTIFQNELYGPILEILREGPMTLEEIKKEYPKYSKKTESPPDKTLYRHLKTLKDAGMVVVAGRRVYEKQTLTQKLFCRTADLFYYRPKEISSEEKERTVRYAELLSKVFQATLNSTKPTPEGLLKILEKIRFPTSNS